MFALSANDWMHADFIYLVLANI